MKMKINWLYNDREYQFLLSEGIDIQKRLTSVFNHGQYINGPEISMLEKEIDDEKYFQNYKCIGVSNGTDAIICSLLSLNIKPGDKVLTTPYTFISTIESIIRIGAIPILCDIHPETYIIDTYKMNLLLKEHDIKCIIPVSIFGHNINYNEYPKNIPIIEDAAQSFWKYTSNRAELLTISCHPTKVYSAMGDAGLIMVRKDLEELYHQIKLRRNHGMEINPEKKYHYNYVGGNWRLDTIQAEVLRCKLPFVSILNHRRKLIAYEYHKIISKYQIKDNYPLSANQHQYTIEFYEEWQLNKFLEYFKEKEITTCRFYPIPLHLQNSYNLGKKGDFPITEEICSKIVALPISPFLEINEVNYICNHLDNFLKENINV